MLVIIMEINIYVESKKFDSDYKDAFSEYAKRISVWSKLNLVIVKRIDKVVPKKGALIYRVVPGKDSISSTELADKINEINQNGFSCIDFVIMPKESGFLSDADTFSVSSFSMCSELTGVVLAEQLYRAYTIQNNITYHK